MQLLDLTLPSPEENLALDEALLDEAEAAAEPCEVLRLWEAPRPMVVVGRSSRLEQEVHLDYCRAQGVAVLRRVSGGAAVVAGPGCLMYAVVLSYERLPHLRPINQAHAYVLDRIATALQTRLAAAEQPPVRREGTSDLALAGMKCSGNSLRCKRRNLLYHGTLLYDFPLPLIAKCLKQPPRQPDYRQNRPHGQFICNLPLPAQTLRKLLTTAWDAHLPLDVWPRRRTEDLVASTYSRQEWVRQF